MAGGKLDSCLSGKAFWKEGSLRTRTWLSNLNLIGFPGEGVLVNYRIWSSSNGRALKVVIMVYSGGFGEKLSYYPEETD